MSVTRLKRKHRKNIARANNEVKKIKDLLRTPVLKNVDLDELKAKFGPAGAPDVAAERNKARVPATDKAAAEKQATLQAKLDEQPAAEAKPEGVFAKVAHAASAAAEAVKHAATDAVEAVSHSAVVESVKETASHAAEAVQEAAHNLVEGAKHVLAEQPKAEAAPSESEPTPQNPAETNQTGTEGFDEAEAVTKPVNADGQEGTHPKPEIHL